MKGDWKSRGFSTRAIHAGQQPDPTTGAVTVPIYATSTYVLDELGRHKGFEYARVQNPTRFALEANVAALEGGASGHAFASGMAAIATLMTLVRTGEHVVFSRNVYGGTYRFMTQVLSRYGVESSWVDSTDLANVRSALRPTTRLIYVETPTNPMMEVTDIAGAAELAHAHGALLAVDNTFMSPYFQRPLELGADVVVHSTTKFLNGHSDSIGGVLVARSAEQGEWFSFVQKSEGAIASPFDSFLILRGIKTLGVRMERHEANGRALAAHLASQPKVRKVFYPGLADHPGHAVQQRQASGFGALITFDLGDFAAAKRWLDRVEVMSLAESLGGVETLTSHPASMTHASVPPDKRAELGITDGLVRISAGIEDLADLLADVDQALAAV
ncbi:MAG: PLP-dependent aspartate aminotransferase family protein [Thermoanaerobaculia bacterium]|nr:PLP-dependent aspartate aminotransferase family protein [Thermoanaerobaculia bacterium]